MTPQTFANNNRLRTPAGCSYYPEMGELPPIGALIEAELSHYGRHYFLKFSATNEATVMTAIKQAKVRFSDRDSFIACTTHEEKITVRMTCAAYDRLHKSAPTICTSALLLD